MEFKLIMGTAPEDNWDIDHCPVELTEANIYDEVSRHVDLIFSEYKEEMQNPADERQFSCLYVAVLPDGKMDDAFALWQYDHAKLKEMLDKFKGKRETLEILLGATITTNMKTLPYIHALINGADPSTLVEILNQNLNSTSN